MVEAIIPRLQSIVVQAKALASIPHPGIKGRLRELFIQEMIKPFLPPSVDVLTGTIVSLRGEREHRTQDDLVLFSKEVAPLLMDLEQAIIPIEGVLAHIEVKSLLTREDLRKAASAALELRNLGENSAIASVAIIFAYDSDNTTGSDVERLLSVLTEIKFSAGPGQSSSPIQMLCVATRGIWLLTRHNNRDGWWFVPPEDSKHLLTFASVISNYVYKSRGASSGIGKYFLDPNWLQGPQPECPIIVS